MNILSLFDGMSCGRIAAERAGIKVDKYYASEVDKPAIMVSQANWPDIIHLGDVTKWREWDIDWANIDLLIGGSPCQGFSFAGKQLAFDDPRSVLFFVYVDILNHIRTENPEVKFLLENVKMKKEHLDVINQHLGVSHVFINSALVSGCERPRHYWANWLIEKPREIDNSFLDYVSDVVQMGEGWNKWWQKNKAFQQKKAYSKVVELGEKGITMTARQYASWNGNFFYHDGAICKPGKKSLAALVGAPVNYFDRASQRQAETMTGNGWTVNVIAHIFNQMQNR